MELDAEEIRIMLIALEWYYDYIDEDEVEELDIVAALKLKLKVAQAET